MSCSAGEGLHRLDLAGAVDEGAVEAAGEVALGVDLVAGADPALHAEHLASSSTTSLPAALTMKVARPASWWAWTSSSICG